MKGLGYHKAAVFRPDLRVQTDRTSGGLGHGSSPRAFPWWVTEPHVPLSANAETVPAADITADRLRYLIGGKPIPHPACQTQSA